MRIKQVTDGPFTLRWEVESDVSIFTGKRFLGMCSLSHDEDNGELAIRLHSKDPNMGGLDKRDIDGLEEALNNTTSEAWSRGFFV